jgi:shikimate kinase
MLIIFFFKALDYKILNPKYLLLLSMSVIILIGFMGCGKSTFGKKLAKQLNYQFMDADDAIEAKYKLKIKDIFSQFGEAHFRKLEEKFILGLDKKQNIILATGGGMPCFGKNMELLNQLGTTFYLQRSIPELVHRLINAKKPRPLIRGKNQSELTEFIEELLPKREVYYLKSHHILNRNQQNPMFVQVLLNQKSGRSTSD